MNRQEAIKYFEEEAEKLNSSLEEVLHSHTDVNYTDKIKKWAIERNLH